MDEFLKKAKNIAFIKKLAGWPFLNRIYHFGLAFLGALIYGFPSRKIYVLGVTGTKGKTTVLEIINSILETAGEKTALLSSLRIKIGGESRKNDLDNTMPGRFFIQKFLRQAVRERAKYALIEVTSQGVVLSRHRFINWQAAIFTNLAPEHIEAHGGFEKYKEAKISFFRYVAKNPKALFILNEDDPETHNFARPLLGNEIVFYSKKDISADYLKEFRLAGDFNKENLAAALAFAKFQKIPEKKIRLAIKNFKGVPGRLDIIQENPFKVVIDYAHTPDSLEKVYEIFKKRGDLPLRQACLRRQAGLICVLGSAGGGRDKWKRPEMGKIAAEFCREIILTNEDPYDEDPYQILAQIRKGIPADSKAEIFEILNREEAIKKAVSLAKKDDVVIMTGKGSESYIHLTKGEKIAWDEKRTVLKALRT